MTLTVVEPPLPLVGLPAPAGRDIRAEVVARDAGRCRACDVAVTLRPDVEPATPGRVTNVLGKAPAGDFPELGIALMCVECADELGRVMDLADRCQYPPGGLSSADRRFWLFARSMAAANASYRGVMPLSRWEVSRAAP